MTSEYDRVSHAASDAFVSGHDDDYRALQERANAIKGEVTVRKQLLNELRDQSNALEEEAEKTGRAAQESAESASKHASLRSRIRELREEMALYSEQFGDQTDEYREMAAELGRLQDIQGDIQAQGSVLADDEAQFQGIITGLSGIAGGFSAAQGAVALFAGENEDLQKIMLRVQSLMSITMGLQQAAQALNKDSAFQLVTINGLKEWWNKLLAAGRGEQVAATAATTANTSAQQANTAAQGGNTAAQAANTVATGEQTTAANICLAGAFRMVGAAIKSLAFGWIAAALSALVAVIVHFVSKANEGKKVAEEFYKSLSENAYKPIAKIEELSVKWNALGDDLDAKKKFVEANKAAFDELGVSINGVTDAENLLIANKQAFINAQIEKAKAMALLQQAQGKAKTLVEEEQKLAAMPEKTSRWVQTSSLGTGYYEEVDNKEKDRQTKKVKALRDEMEKLFEDAAVAESNGWKELEKAGIDTAVKYGDGTLGAIQQAIQAKQESLKKLTSNEKYKATMKEIEDLQKQAAKITGETKETSTATITQDPFIENLNKYKSEYQRFQKYVNSGNEVLVRSANQEFANLLAEGATYIDYLKNQRDQILSIDVANHTKARDKQLRQLNDAIAEETRTTILEAFNEELNAQLTNAQTVLDKLNIIEQKRKGLSGDGTELDNAKAESLNEAEENAQDQLRQETESLLEE